jgi:DNA-3-methyladenine glycosylase I
MKKRCHWANSHELFIPYHDEEWGVPVHDDRLLFEMLNLEGAQAGLSWLTILKKRDGYRKAFARFDARKVAKFDAKKRKDLVKNPQIVRHPGKIAAVVENAQAFLRIQKEFGSFSAYLWGFVYGKPINARLSKEGHALSERLSKDLKKRGFRFVGATTIYAFLQAVGVVDDHSADCFRAKKKR